jgi:hypothetical protein
MPLSRLPYEVHTEILTELVRANCRLYAIPRFLISEIVPYLLASRTALDCWRNNGHVILHRVAVTILAETADYRRRLRRAFVLARLRILVSRAALRNLDMPFYRLYRMYVQHRHSYGKAKNNWEFEERIADYWRSFLLG